MTTITRQTISDATGFDHGDQFTSEEQVREYFTADSQREMFGDDAETDPETLESWADAVIENRWHMSIEAGLKFDVIDAPTDGTAGNHCGTYSYDELQPRLRAAIDANPDAGEWVLPALSDGDSGEPLTDLQTIVRVAD